MIKSTDEFLEIIRNSRPNGLIASLDVTSLFTNVPVEPTIAIICQSVYNHPELPPPDISQENLKHLLRCCTKEAPFRHIDNNIYIQKDGVAMGSPLSCTFANYYMCHIENEVLASLNEDKPTTYCRYVDDIFVVVRNEEHLNLIKQKLELASVLEFTTKISINNKIPFLDVSIDGSTGAYRTSIYKKKTDSGKVLNGSSECPERYKTGMIRTLIQRSYKISSDWTLFEQDIKRLKQTLVNNGYSNSMFDQICNKFLENVNNTSTQIIQDNSEVHTIFYKNQMSNAYKTDEKVLKAILKNNIKCTNDSDKLKVVIYYKNKKTSSLVMRNNLNPVNDDLKQSNVIYEYTCKNGDCGLQSSISSYIGETVTTLSRRLTMHLQSGTIKEHTRDEHGINLKREDLVNNTKILKKENDNNRLHILEAILIRKKKPVINIQNTGNIRILKLFAMV